MRLRNQLTISTAIIHCSATPNGRFHDIVDIDRWHGPDREKQNRTPFRRADKYVALHEPHLKHVGYHYVIRTDGVLELGRSIQEVGAHAKGWNDYSIGICLIGYDKFTPAQWQTLRTLMITLQQTLPRLHRIIGHRDVASYKLCPCFNVETWVNTGFHALSYHTLKTQ